MFFFFFFPSPSSHYTKLPELPYSCLPTSIQFYPEGKFLNAKLLSQSRNIHLRTLTFFCQISVKVSFFLKVESTTLRQTHSEPVSKISLSHLVRWPAGPGGWFRRKWSNGAPKHLKNTGEGGYQSRTQVRSSLGLWSFPKLPAAFIALCACGPFQGCEIP